jgi:hypothetical protein
MNFISIVKMFSILILLSNILYRCYKIHFIMQNIHLIEYLAGVFGVVCIIINDCVLLNTQVSEDFC